MIAAVSTLQETKLLENCTVLERAGSAVNCIMNVLFEREKEVNIGPDAWQLTTAEAVLRGVGVATWKSAELLSVSVQPLAARNNAELFAVEEA